METIELRIGDRRTLRLPGHRSGEYGWRAGGYDVAVIGLAPGGAAPGAPMALPGGATPSHDEIFDIVAQRAGETPLRFQLAPASGQGKTPLATCDFRVIVLPPWR